jgi:hypothetical protein
MKDKQVIWESDLDNGKYNVEVHRLDERHGQLVVLEAATGKEIMSEKVHLAYGAAFGPDMADVLLWQEMICSRIPDPKESSDGKA